MTAGEMEMFLLLLISVLSAKLTAGDSRGRSRAPRAQAAIIDMFIPRDLRMHLYPLKIQLSLTPLTPTIIHHVSAITDSISDTEKEIVAHC